jgi:predicted RNA-binding protein with RPS1 domain
MKLSGSTTKILLIAAASSLQATCAFMNPQSTGNVISNHAFAINQQELSSALAMSTIENENAGATKPKTKPKQKRRKAKVSKVMMEKTNNVESSNNEKKAPRRKKKNSNNNRRKKKSTNPNPNPTIKAGQKKEKLLPLKDLKLGSTISGHVAAFTSFGLFIKTNYDFKNKGACGYALLHKSQIRDEPVDDLSKLFRVGAKIKGLRVIKVNYAKGEVGVSLRTKRSERTNIKDVPVGEEIEGVVSKVVSYGAFVDIGANVNALVHISRISQNKIRNIRQVINEGEKVKIHILNKDVKKKTMAASMLDGTADEYLDRRSEQMKKMRESIKLDNLKTELEYFEDAVRELEEALE